MPKEGKGAESDEETELEEEETTEEEPEVDEFDKERALATIKKQRESEDKLKKQLAKYKAAEQEAEDAEKSKDQLIADRDARILELERVGALSIAIAEFEDQAREAGIADPRLALLVAKENGLLGDYDPKSGQYEVGKVDFDQLLEDYPVLDAGEESDPERSAPFRTRPKGDAGKVTNTKTAKSNNALFNDALRG